MAVGKEKLEQIREELCVLRLGRHRSVGTTAATDPDPGFDVTYGGQTFYAHKKRFTIRMMEKVYGWHWFVRMPWKPMDFSNFHIHAKREWAEGETKWPWGSCKYPS